QRDPGGDRALSLAAPPGLYSIGEPTDDEQLYVELINRARADPAAEGRRLVATMDPDIIAAYEFFGVDLNRVVEQFDAISAAPPLSIHPQLTAAARRHSMDMFENQFQGHDGSDGSDAEQRVTEAGYDWSAISENVFAYSLSAWYGHVAFSVNWGNGP